MVQKEKRLVPFQPDQKHRVDVLGEALPIVTLKSNRGKDVTQIGGFAGGEVLDPLSVGLRDHVLPALTES